MPFQVYTFSGTSKVLWEFCPLMKLGTHSLVYCLSFELLWVIYSFMGLSAIVLLKLMLLPLACMADVPDVGKAYMLVLV